MKKGISIVFAFFLIIPAFSQNPDNPGQKIIQSLNQIEQLYLKYLSQSELKQAIAILNETRALVAGTSSYTNDVQHFMNVMNEQTFHAMLEKLKKEISDSRKTEIIQSIGKSGKITCLQLEQFVKLYSFDSSREELIYAVSNNILDPVNISIVLQHISSTFTQDEISKFFREKQ